MTAEEVEELFGLRALWRRIVSTRPSGTSRRMASRRWSKAVNKKTSRKAIVANDPLVDRLLS